MDLKKLLDEIKQQKKASKELGVDEDATGVLSGIKMAIKAVEWQVDKYYEDCDEINKPKQSWQEIKRLLVDNKLRDRRVRCIYCRAPIHIDNWAGIHRRGMFCQNTVCLTAMLKEGEENISP